MKPILLGAIIGLLGPCLAPALAEVPVGARLVPVSAASALPHGVPGALPRVFAPAPLIAGAGTPGMLCRQAIRATERAFAIPEHLMAAIARVESGRLDAQGVVHPWPWTINAEGVGHYFESKAEAIAAVRALQARGVTSIDVGCMQVNLLHHPTAFASLDQAFDPVENARYAAQFLLRLKTQAGEWPKATALYHSATPDLGSEYARRVAAVWPEERQRQAAIPAGSGNVWSTNAWTANAWNTGAAPLAGGGQMLSNKADAAHIIPMPQGATVRGLDAYRATPIPGSGKRVVTVARTPPG